MRSRGRVCVRVRERKGETMRLSSYSMLLLAPALLAGYVHTHTHACVNV